MPLALVCSSNLRALEVNEVALTFTASTHQGDKRRTSQQCSSANMCAAVAGVCVYHVVAVFCVGLRPLRNSFRAQDQ